MDRRANGTKKRPMEMIMSTTFSPPAPAPCAAGQARIGGSVAALKRWWMAYLTWRVEQAAIAQLHMMSDRELKDIGLTRSQIMGAVRGEAENRLFSRYC